MSLELMKLVLNYLNSSLYRNLFSLSNSVSVSVSVSPLHHQPYKSHYHRLKKFGTLQFCLLAENIMLNVEIKLILKPEDYGFVKQKGRRVFLGDSNGFKQSL